MFHRLYWPWTVSQKNVFLICNFKEHEKNNKASVSELRGIFQVNCSCWFLYNVSWTKGSSQTPICWYFETLFPIANNKNGVKLTAHVLNFYTSVKRSSLLLLLLHNKIHEHLIDEWWGHNMKSICITLLNIRNTQIQKEVNHYKS